MVGEHETGPFRPRRQQPRAPALSVRRVPLTTLKPRWLYVAEPTRYGMGLSLNCPDHPDLDEADRLELWFDLNTKPDRLFNYEGHAFEDITIWQALPYPDEAVMAGHWRGYISNGSVYSCFRWSAF